MEPRYKNTILIFLSFALCLVITIKFTGCASANSKPNSAEFIKDLEIQKSTFNMLLTLTNNIVADNEQNDSLAFLLLPVEASCPSCRNKTIDSIIKHGNNLDEGHFIIITASGGQKTINSYFREQDGEIPLMENKLFLDSTNKASEFKLVKDNPVIYYTANKKAFEKVSAIPATIRDDLRNFFSGSRFKLDTGKRSISGKTN